MTRASRGLRWAEIALWLIGVSLLGVSLGAAADRWAWQAAQERALDQAIAVHVRSAPGERVLIADTSVMAGGTPGLAADGGGTPAVEETKEDVSDEGPSVGVADAGVAEAGAVKPAGKEAILPGAIELAPGLLGRIEIPRIGLSAIVRAGDDAGTLKRAVGFISGTALPGSGGNTGLAAHRDTFFRPLERIKVDDRIRLVTPEATYEYRVDSLRVVEPTEVSVLESAGTEELTLVTCHPFRYIGPAPDRFIVKASRVE